MMTWLLLYERSSMSDSLLPLPDRRNDGIQRGMRGVSAEMHLWDMGGGGSILMQGSGGAGEAVACGTAGIRQEFPECIAHFGRRVPAVSTVQVYSEVKLYACVRTDTRGQVCRSNAGFDSHPEGVRQHLSTAVVGVGRDADEKLPPGEKDVAAFQRGPRGATLLGPHLNHGQVELRHDPPHRLHLRDTRRAVGSLFLRWPRKNNPHTVHKWANNADK